MVTRTQDSRTCLDAAVSSLRSDALQVVRPEMPSAKAHSIANRGVRVVFGDGDFTLRVSPCTLATRCVFFGAPVTDSYWIDRNLLSARPLVLSAARVRENSFSLSVTTRGGMCIDRKSVV